MTASLISNSSSTAWMIVASVSRESFSAVCFKWFLAMEMTSFSSVWSITGTGTSSGRTPETS